AYIYALSLHDALPISQGHFASRYAHRDGVRVKSGISHEGVLDPLSGVVGRWTSLQRDPVVDRNHPEHAFDCFGGSDALVVPVSRSEEHTSELQSRENL